LDVSTLEGWLWVHRDLDDQGQEVHIDDFEDDARLGTSIDHAGAARSTT
jgi:hypothetical protein